MIKHQITNILAQNHDNLKVIVNFDASKDNTHMFVKYMLDENKQKSNLFTLSNEAEHKGFIANFKNNQCQ